MARRPPRSPYFLAALVGAAIVVAGCGPAGKVGAALVLKEAVAANKASVAAGARASFTSAVPKITARSAPVIAGRSEATVIVRSERVAATSIAKSPPARAVAEESATKIQALAAETATEPTGRARIRTCARSGAMSGAEAYAKAVAAMHADGQPPPDLEAVLSNAIGTCLGDAFPNQPAAVRHLTKALVSSIGQSTQQVSEAGGVSAQAYTDWLVYTVSLYAQSETTPADADVAPVDSNAVPARWPVAESGDALLVVLSHAHAGRVAVANQDWASAIENRRFVLGEPQALSVAAELEPARRALAEAMRNSLAADRAHAACAACPSVYDGYATSAKEAFLAEYNPYIEEMYGRRLDATQI
jgi:hypothetical protein